VYVETSDVIRLDNLVGDITAQAAVEWVMIGSAGSVQVY